jgi:hypothetical protein
VRGVGIAALGRGGGKRGNAYERVLVLEGAEGAEEAAHGGGGGVDVVLGGWRRRVQGN